MKFRLLLLALSISLFSFSQAWLSQLPSNKLKNELTLSDYQSAFYTYWSGKNVVDGKYLENGVWKKAYGWKQFKRWENYWEPRVNVQNQTFPTAIQYKTADYQYEQTATQNHSLSGQWINLGPSSSNGGYAGVGRIATIAFHPSDANAFWIGAPTGGLWKTTDNGANWTVLTDQNTVLGVSAIGIPSDYDASQTIYIGTGDRDSWHHDNGNGIFKSTDGGASWNVSLPFNVATGYTVNQILIHPNNNNIIYAATTDGIYKTTDAGANWTNIYDVNYIVDLEFKPTDPSILYATSKWNGTIYKITNDGANVSEVYNDPDANRIELTVTADNSNLVYAIVSNSDYGLKSILKSTDSGDSFSLVTDSPNILASAADGSGTSGQGWYDLALKADPNDQDILYAGGVNTWKSDDGGATWEIINHWWGDGVQAVHADKHYININNGIVYECNDGGLYSSNNEGADWTNISNGIINSQMYKLAVAQTVNNQTITGLQDNGTKLLSGGIWNDVVGGDGMNCKIDPFDEDVMYGGIQNGKIMRTTDGWNSQDYITRDSDGNPINGLDETGAWVTPYVINPNTPNELFMGLENVWKTTDRGDSWIKISNINATDKIKTIAVSNSNDQVVYTASDTQIWMTTNQGGSWTEITNGLPSDDITSIAIKNDDPNTVWITFGSFDSDVVYQSTNGGSTWTNISTGLPNVPSNIVIQNTQNTNETELYIGTDFGVYVKRGTVNWELFNTNMPKTIISDLAIYYDADANNSKLRAASWGRGLWESDLYSGGAAAPVADFSANATTICANDTVSFTDLSTNIPTAWSWTISPNSGFSYINGSDANSQNPQISFTNSGSYTISLNASNSGGNDDEIKSDYITVNAVPVADFSADQTTVNEGATVNFTDLSSNSPNSWSWSFAGGTPSNSSSQNPAITYNTAGTYQVQLIASKNGCSDSESKSAYIHVNTVVLAPVADFSANTTTICADDTVTFTDLSTNTPTAWSWTISPNPGFSYINGSDANSQNPQISFTNSGSYTISLNASNSGGSDDEIKIDFILVNPLPEDIGAINGDDIVCANSTQTYMVNNISGTIYNWTLPTGWTGSSTSSSIDVVNNGTGGTISVYAENSCGIGNTEIMNVEVINSVASQPSVISGPNPVCENSGASYSVVDVPGVTYYWNLPSGWTGSGNESTISVNTNTNGGTITLVPFNACGIGVSRTFNVSVNQQIGVVSAMMGNTEACEGSVQNYFITAENASSYSWTLPSGWSGTSNFSSINVTVGNLGGDVSVTPENACGTAATVSLAATVNLQPVSNFSYTSNQAEYTFNNLSQNADSYLWNFGDGQNSTDENPIHSYATTGTYNVNLMAENQCAQRNYYASINVIVLDVSTLQTTGQTTGITAFPNPTSGLIRIKGLENNAKIILMDATGKIIINKFMEGSKELNINLQAYSEGIYQIVITQNKKVFKQKIILEK